MSGYKIEHGPYGTFSCPGNAKLRPTRHQIRDTSELMGERETIKRGDNYFYPGDVNAFSIGIVNAIRYLREKTSTLRLILSIAVIGKDLPGNLFQLTINK